MAGESAADLARRQREKAERLLQAAERWEQGAAGERATGEVLDALKAEGWAVFHDVRWPGRERANIDHVVVGPPGVFVIDSKNWSGRIEVRDDTFRAHGRRQDKVVAAAAEAALAVTSLTSPPAGQTTRSVLCFVRDEPVVGWCHDVMLCSTANLRDVLTSGPAVLDQTQIRLAGIELELAFRAGAQAAEAQAHERASARGSRRAPRRAPRSAPRSAARSAPRQRSRKRKGRSVASQLAGLVVFLLLAALMIAALPHLPDLAARIGDKVVEQSTTTYASCRELRKVHPGGVGTEKAVAKVRRKQHRPLAQDGVYAANKALDTDGDGLICVRRPHAR